ncbi:MAG: DUF1801 domain-containing protein [Ignavibacteriaceae bacterium]
MKSTDNKPKTIDEYINKFPKEVKVKLEQIRKTIKKAAPDAKEVISYQMPAFKLNSVLVYFAAFKDHISFFPTSSPIKVFAEELSGYETSKGTIKFPLVKKIPLDLVAKITRFRLKEDTENHNRKNKK